MWNILNTIAGCVCIYLLVYWVLEFRRARKKFEEVEKEFRNRSLEHEISIDKMRDNSRIAANDCKRELEEHSKAIDTLKWDLGEVITKTDSLSKAFEYFSTNPASLAARKHKELIKDVAQIKAELEAITAIVNRGMVKQGKKNTYLTKP